MDHQGIPSNMLFKKWILLNINYTSVNETLSTTNIKKIYMATYQDNNKLLCWIKLFAGGQHEESRP